MTSLAAYERAANSCFRVAPTESYMQFSKKPILANFGDLPRGEIPEPLKFNRPFCKYSIFDLTRLSQSALWNSCYLLLFTIRDLNPKQRNQSCNWKDERRYCNVSSIFISNFIELLFILAQAHVTRLLLHQGLPTSFVTFWLVELKAIQVLSLMMKSLHLELVFTVKPVVNKLT